MNNHQPQFAKMIRQSFISCVSQASTFHQITQQILQRIPSYIHSQLECPVCLQYYNLSSRSPMIICQNSHGCCQNCMNDLMKKQNLCMFCRKQINKDKVHKNRFIVKVIQGEMQRKKKLKEQIKKRRKENLNIRKSVIINQNDKAKNNQMRRQLNEQQYQQEDQYHQVNQKRIKSSQQLKQPLLQRVNLNKSSYNNEQEQILRNHSQLNDRNNSKLNCGIQQYCITYVQILIISVPFIICQLYYSIYQQYQLQLSQISHQSSKQFHNINSLIQSTCLDTLYSQQLSLTFRQWLISSACFGIFIYLFQLIVIFLNYCCRSNKQCLKKMTIILTILIQIKIGIYNFIGVYLFFNINDKDKYSQKCSESLVIYMNVFYWLYLFYFIPHFFWFFYSIKQFTCKKQENRPNQLRMRNMKKAIA